MNDFEQFEKWMINDARFSPHTVSQTMRKIRYIFEHYNQPLSVFSFQDFIREVWEKKGNKTANGYIKIINRWLRFKGIEEMKYFKEYGSEFTVQYCSPEEKRLLLQAAERKGLREKAMFYLLFGTGVRLAEACDLKFKDILPDRIKVVGKGQKVREVYLPPEAYKAIKAYLNVRTPTDSREDAPYLFTTKARRKMTYAFFRKICSDVAFGAGVKFHPHMARHTYATDLLKAGVSVVYVSQLLGHEDLESTAIYLHPSQLEAIEKARSVDLFNVQNPHESHGLDRRGAERPHANQFEHKDSDFKEESEDDDEPPGELKEKALLVLFSELMQHPVRSKSSRVGINATPSPDAVRNAPNHHFLSPINATPREDKCNTINATPVRKPP
jgi:site-specific recombinase XerD